MKKAFTVGAIVVFLFCFTARAFPWGSAVHAYIVDKLKVDMGQAKLNAIYGGMAPDIFNYVFDPNVQLLAQAMHVNFLPLWLAADTQAKRQLAYGFVSHNDIWGIDFTAHSAGTRFYKTDGYIIGKAKILAEILKSRLRNQGLELPKDVLINVCHNLVEKAIDVIMKRVDQMIGQKIFQASSMRDDAFPDLLAGAFGIDPGFASLAEGQFRTMMVGYGWMLTQDEAYAIEAISALMAGFAADYLAANGVSLPPGTDLLPIIRFAHVKSMELCQGTFAKEIESTIQYVKGGLAYNGIDY